MIANGTEPGVQLAERLGLSIIGTEGTTQNAPASIATRPTASAFIGKAGLRFAMSAKLDFLGLNWQRSCSATRAMPGSCSKKSDWNNRSQTATTTATARR